MTVTRSFVAAVALIAAIAMSAIGAITAPAARTGASPFELTLEGKVGPDWEVVGPVEGTFAARAPFCRSGTSVLEHTRERAQRRFICDDGSGSLVVSMGPYWRVLEGTGSYADIRGNGSVRSELLSEDPDGSVTWRTTFQGIADDDAIAPTIGFSSVKVTKLRRPAGVYSLKLAIAVRDNVEGNPVSYMLQVTTNSSGLELARTFGTTQAGAVSMTMRVRPNHPRARAILLRLTASDEVGNVRLVSHPLRLPRR